MHKLLHWSSNQQTNFPLKGTKTHEDPRMMNSSKALYSLQFPKDKILIDIQNKIQITYNAKI